jgi:amidase
MATFITRLDHHGDGPRLAVKDIVDVHGVPTTCGSRAVARDAEPAAADAACLAGARAAGAAIVGKTNLHELAVLPLGTNPWFGTPLNPRDPAVLPGGSSSGSAVAVATGEADMAIGTDTGGSVRIPSACCGTVGLKTTYGRVPTDGVRALAPSLDTVGPMGRSARDVAACLALLDPAATSVAPARRVGRIRTDAHPDIERAVDHALAASGLEVVSLDWSGLEQGMQHFTAIFFAEILETVGPLAAANPDDVGADITGTLALAASIAPGAPAARAAAIAWGESLMACFADVDLLALPTLPSLPPRLESLGPDSLVATITELSRFVAPFNVAGLPAIAQPVPLPGSVVPASLQLVGAPDSEALLVSSALLVEEALAVAR